MQILHNCHVFTQGHRPGYKGTNKVNQVDKKNLTIHYLTHKRMHNIVYLKRCVLLNNITMCQEYTVVL